MKAEIAELRTTLLAGAQGPAQRAAAHKLEAALALLAQTAPTVETRDLLQQILDSHELDGFVDHAGVSCRVAVIKAQLALGFPLALEVSPEDLALLRKEAKNTERHSSNTGTLWASAISTLYYLAGVVLGGDFDLPVTLSLLAAGHGLAVFLTALRSKPNQPIAQRRRYRFRYRLLAWAAGAPGLLTLAATVLMGGGEAFLAGLTALGPLLLTALACQICASELVPEDGDQPATR